VREVTVRRIFTDPVSELPSILREESVWGGGVIFPDRLAIFAPGFDGLDVREWNTSMIGVAGMHRQIGDLPRGCEMAILGLLQ
jgi:hypothetical protein